MDPREVGLEGSLGAGAALLAELGHVVVVPASGGRPGLELPPPSGDAGAEAPPRVHSRYKNSGAAFSGI